MDEKFSDSFDDEDLGNSNLILTYDSKRCL
jgi:hypothetical protein